MADHLRHPMGPDHAAGRDEIRRIPEATVARLPVYLRILTDLAAGNTATISSEHLAELAGVNAAKVRKDLSYLGSYGTRGVGYDVEFLLFQIASELGVTTACPIVIVGAGNLGQALANYARFGERGFSVVALIDVDPAKVGQKVGSVPIRPVDELTEIVRRSGTRIGVIATDASGAQAAADSLVSAGVNALLNFAPVTLLVPAEVSLRKVDLAVELQILSFYQQRGPGMVSVGDSADDPDDPDDDADDDDLAGGGPGTAVPA